MPHYSTQESNIIPINEYAVLKKENERLRNHINKLQGLLKKVQFQNNIQEEPSDTIMVNIDGSAHYIQLSNIILIKAIGNYTVIFLSSGTQLITCKSLKYWSNKLENKYNFIRPHRSCVINKLHIISYKLSSRILELTGNNITKVSRTYNLLQ